MFQEIALHLPALAKVSLSVHLAPPGSLAQQAPKAQSADGRMTLASKEATFKQAAAPSH